MKISLLEKKLKDQEVILAQQTCYFNILKEEKESKEISSPAEEEYKASDNDNKNYLSRSSLKIQSLDLEDEHEMTPLPFHQLVLTKPFSFYSFNYIIYDEQKLDLYKDSVLKLVKFRNKDLEQQARHIQYDMNHLSSQVKELKVEEKEKIKMILDMRKEIFNLKFQIQADKVRAEEEKMFAIEEVREEFKVAQDKFELYRKVVAEEIDINENIRRNQKIKINDLENLIKKMQKVLSIPRLHYKYLESIVVDNEGKARNSETSPSIQKSASVISPGFKTSRNIYTNMKTRTIQVNVDGKDQCLKYSMSRLVSPTRQKTEQSIRSPMSCADLKPDSNRLLPSYEKFKATLETQKGIISAWSQNQESSETSTQVQLKENYKSLPKIKKAN